MRIFSRRNLLVHAGLGSAALGGLLPGVGYVNAAVPIDSKVLIPDGTIYTANNTGFTSLPTGAEWGLQNNAFNPAAFHFVNHVRPRAIKATHSRRTLALDVHFNSSYLLSAHMGLAARHRGGNYRWFPDNACGAIICGAWHEGQRAVGLEEIEIGATSPTNTHHNTVANLLNADTWYRIVLDSIAHYGTMMHELRVTDKSTGILVYSTPTLVSAFTDQYHIASQHATLFSIAGGDSVMHYTNFMSYWSEGGVWVPNP